MPILPNNFRVTQHIGVTDNFAGAEVAFFWIDIIGADSTPVDLRGELGYNQTVYNVVNTIMQRGIILYQRIDNSNSGRMDVCLERTAWTAGELQNTIRALGNSVGTNSIDVSGTQVYQTELKLDNS
jgi:hypothetical protein